MKTLLLALALAGAASPLFAQDTRLLVVTGVSGDEEHAATFKKWATEIIDAAKTKDGKEYRGVQKSADAVTVQMLDMAGVYHSFEKASLAELKIEAKLESSAPQKQKIRKEQRYPLMLQETMR